MSQYHITCRCGETVDMQPDFGSSRVYVCRSCGSRIAIAALSRRGAGEPRSNDRDGWSATLMVAAALALVGAGFLISAFWPYLVVAGVLWLAWSRRHRIRAWWHEEARS